MHLANTRTELRHAARVCLDAGKTLADVFAALEAGGPNAPAPGSTSVAVVDLMPGTWVFLCLAPSPDGTPHMKKGTVHSFNRRAACHVCAGCYQTGRGARRHRPTRCHDHAHRLRLHPLAPAHARPHEIFIAPSRREDGRRRDGTGRLDAEPAADGADGRDRRAGARRIERHRRRPRARRVRPLLLPPDANDGKPHVMHGMVRQITIR